MDGLMPTARLPASVQAPAAVVMVRPHRFHPNPETAADNAFQSGAPARADRLGSAEAERVARQARDEFDAAVHRLESAGITVHRFDDDGRHDTPDAVFPNNWFSTHAGGRVALYPMCSPSRRRERRADIVEWLKRHYRVSDVVDYSGHEPDGRFLEGTGAMVLDQVGRLAWVARSRRADPVLLERFGAQFGYEPVLFDTADAEGRPVYHTNVLMCIATDFVLIGAELIASPGQRAEVLRRLHDSGRDIILLSEGQIREFAGNALELSTREGGRRLALSARAAAALTPAQRQRIERSAPLLPLAVPTIERAGGSVRCMLAGIHLAPRPQA